jgi:hypothetical protein
LNAVKIYIDRAVHVSAYEGKTEMKCWTHPKVDAVAVCVSCGKGLCKECSIVIAGNTYCKTCVESERWKAPPTPPAAPPVAPPTPPPTPVIAEPTPTPTGVPSKAQFIVGGVGSILNTIASIPMFLFTITLWIAMIYYYEEYTYLYPILSVGVVGSILLIIGIIMAAIGYFGFRRNYGSGMGTASFVFAIIVAVLLIIIAFVDITLIYAGEPYYEYTTRWVIVLVGQIIWFLLFGVMQILWGITHIVTRKFTGHSGLSLATGIMLIIAGSLISVMTFVGMALFFVAEIMASVLFFTLKVPTVSKP